MGFKLRYKNVASPSPFKEDPGSKTTYEYRDTTSYKPSGRVRSVNSGGGGKTYNDKTYKRWGTEYIYGLKNAGLLDSYRESVSGPYKNMRDRYDLLKNYYSTLSPEQQWQVQDYRYRTNYPNKYEEWQKLNPRTETTVKEQRATTTTPGTSGESGGSFENVWANMSPEAQAEHGGDYDKWKTSAEQWNAENKTDPTVNQGDWEEVSRTTKEF